MRLNEIDGFIALINAWKQGKTIEYLVDSKWKRLPRSENIGFSEPLDCYRIAQPVLRPWKRIEVPLHALLKSDYCDQLFVIMGVPENQNDNGIRLVYINAVNKTSHKWQVYDAFGSHMNYSIDFGQTWHPCGVWE